MGIDKTVVAGLVAAVTLAGGTAAAGASASAPTSEREAPTVTGADLPSVKQIARLYPFLEGGERQKLSNRSLTVAAQGDCVSQRQIGRATSGKWAFYTTAEGESGFFEGKEDPTVFVYRMATQEKAERTMKRLNRFVERCAGRNEADGVATTITRVPRLPGLGAQRVGYRKVNEDTEVRSHELHVLVRRGRTIVEAYLQARAFSPDRARGVRVARLLLRTSSPS